MRTKVIITIFSIAILGLNVSMAQETQRQKTIKSTLEYLASDQLEGRAPASTGDSLAIDFIVKSFKKIGLRPAFINEQGASYVQKTNFSIPIYNVSGVLDIKDNNLKTSKSKYIVLGAHYDHLGMGGEKSGSRRPDTLAVHNGADDNASGVSGMIAIAEHFAKIKGANKIVFVAFGGEEKGLVGSKYFADNLPVAKEDVLAMINFDMIGSLRGNSLMVGGIGSAQEFDGLVGNVNKSFGSKNGQVYDYFKLTLSQQGYGPSDHSSFYIKGIPVLYLTTGATETYHTPQDDACNINYLGIDSVVNFSIELINRLSTFDSLTYKESEAPATMPVKKQFKVTLGIMPDVVGTTERGMKADVVIKDRPAYKAGLKSGDVIIKMNEMDIANIEDYMKALSSIKEENDLNIKVIRDGKELLFVVKFK